MAIEFINYTPGSGMTYKGLRPLSEVPPGGTAPLPCILCGDPSVRDFLFKDCYDSLSESFDHAN